MGYHFIGLAERFDESMVVLRLLLGLEAHEVLYIPTNYQGSFALFHQKCIEIKKTILTPPIQQYIQSPEFQNNNTADYLFYSAVNKSLDLTIQYTIGYNTFQKALQEHQYLMSLVRTHCIHRVKHFCPKAGKPKLKERNNCYHMDYGCGYDCLDKLQHNLTRT